MEDSMAELPSWRWALRIFLSADLAGATALKYQAQASWMRTITDFYTAFAADLGAHIGAAWSRLGGAPTQQAPGLWKGLGDELVFVQEVRSLEAVLASVAGFASAVRAHNRSVEESANRASRPVKATAWCAGFPLSNRSYGIDAVSGEPSQSSGTMRAEEYVGPSLDLGFRLCKYADHASDRLVLAPDLAWLILRALEECPRLSEEFRWMYAGRSVFAGVRLGEPVPVVLLNLLTSESASPEARLLRREAAESDPALLAKFLGDYLPRSEHWPYPPFIFHDARVRPPQDVMDALEKQRHDAHSTEEAEALNYVVEGSADDQARGDPSHIVDLPPMG